VYRFQFNFTIGYIGFKKLQDNNKSNYSDVSRSVVVVSGSISIRTELLPI